ncbi:carboxypeptidase regulatory-like domain-containing protein [Oscillospiraceae bacterium PP1C4]
MKQSAGRKFLSAILSLAMIISMGVSPVYAVEGGELPVIIPEQSSITVVETQTCSSCGKAAHEGACETTENTEPEAEIPTTEPEAAIPTTEGKKECTCPTVDSGEVTHKEDCPQYIAPAYQCSLCKDERLDEHKDGICPVEPPKCELEGCVHIQPECSIVDCDHSGHPAAGAPLCAWGAWEAQFKTSLQPAMQLMTTQVWDGTLPAANPGYAYSGGTGADEANAYQIANSYDLAMLSANVNTGYSYSSGKYFKLTADIVLNETLDGSPKAWTPIGLSINKFQGTFDGGGHTVKGVYINNAALSYIGLFGFITGATVKNVGVIESSITGNECVGGVVGATFNSTVQNCYSTTTILGTRLVGGVAGQAANNSTVQNCYNTGTVSGNNYDSLASEISNIGGVVGAAYNSAVQNCYNTGAVSGKSKLPRSGAGIGGVAGVCWDNSKVENCYNTGEIIEGFVVGGIVGIVSGTDSVKNCVALGQTVTGSWKQKRVGNSDTSAFASCYARSDMIIGRIGLETTVTDGAPNNENGADLLVSNTTAQNWNTWFSDSSAWDMTNVGMLEANAKLPILKDFSSEQNPTLPDGAAAPNPTEWDGTIPTANPAYSYSGGAGSSASPYLIASGADLAMLAANVNAGTNYSGKYFKQTADIVLNDSLNSSPKVWKPIGISEWSSFQGTFDGSGHTVKGVYINNTLYYQGLFGYTNGAVIRNLGVIESSITGSYYVGGVAGSSQSSTVEQCFNTGNVLGQGFVGGVVGQAYEKNGVSLVQNCYNTGSITGQANMGGVVGLSSNTTTVQNCYSTGNVTGSGLEVGGVVGRSSGSSDTGSSVISNVQNCVALGQTVTAVTNGYVGRVVGRADMNAPITNCYARSDMKIGISGSEATVTGGAVNNKNGADLLVSNATAQDWNTWFSDSSAWDYPAENLVVGAKLPTLKGFSAVQNPTLLKGAPAPNPTKWDGTSPEPNSDYSYSGGDGNTESTAYKIANSYDLAMLAANTNTISSYSSGKYFKQTADIVLNSTISSSAKQWTPIGCYEKRFGGTYDGSGYTISGVYIYDPDISTGQIKALFGCAQDALIKNVGIINSQFTASANVGSLVAVSNESTVENCYNTGNVVGEVFVGGLIGQNGGDIKNCYNTGNVRAATRSDSGCVGGVAGLSQNDTRITNCVYLGTSIIGNNAGRIVGFMQIERMGTFDNCYARSDMTINGATVSGGTATNLNGKDLLVSSSTTQDWNTWFNGSTAWNYPTAKLIIGAILPTLKGSSSAQKPTLPGSSVVSVPVTGVTLNKSTLTLQEREGETLNATVAPTTATNKAVTWKSSNDSIATVTNGTVNAIKAGNVIITVTTTDGAKSASCNVNVIARPTINITAQPQNVSVVQDKTASFTVAATMTPTGALSYQWYSNTSNSTSGGTPISGATSATYSPATATIGTAYYYCVVSGGGAVSVTSSTAKLTVTPSTITIAGIVYDTNNANPVSDAKVKLTPPVGKNEQTTGTSGQYTFSNIPVGAYTITVTYPDGSIVTKNVTDPPIDYVITQNFTKPAPTITITTQPQDVTVLPGKSATFTVAAKLSTTAGALSYQWYSNTSNSTMNGTLIPSATSATYAPVTATAGTTYYYCVVSSDNGATSVTSKVARLSVKSTTTITGIVKDKDGNPVSNATVILTPNVCTPNPVMTGNDGKYEFNVPDGKYTITVTLPNGGGTITKELTVPDDIGAGVDIQQPVTPVIMITAQPKDVTVLQNKTASFTMAAGVSNGAAVTYQWYSNTSNSTMNGTRIPNTTRIIDITATATAGTTYYYCVASADGVASVTSKVARLTVCKTSTIDGIVKDKDGVVVKDATVTLSPNAGSPNPSTTGSDGKYKFEDVPDGDYTIIVTLPNGGGTIIKDITVPSDISAGVDIQQPAAPVITVSAQPKDVTTALNDTATFTVAAGVSSGTLVYQWYQSTNNSTTSGTLISGANAASYSPFTAAKGESYYYCVLNATGATPVTTSVAKLTVRNAMTGTTITGTVKDKDGNAVSGATVTITDKNNPGNKHTTTTGTDGAYIFTGVPDSVYTITVTLPQPNGGTISGGNITVTDGTPTNSIEIKQPTVPTVIITGQPHDISVTAGQSASFVITASASSGSVTYQWYRSTTNSNMGGTKIDDATAATYTHATSTADTAYYYCEVSGTDAQPVTSNAVKLTVTAATAPTGTVEGSVTDDTTHALLADVEVKVMKGGTHGTQFGTTIKTDATGKFEFKVIPYGSYSLVATKGEQIVTKQINIKAARITENLVMLSGNKDTKVEVKGGAPSVAAENLTEMFTRQDNRLTSESAAKVEIKLVVEKVASPAESEAKQITAIVQKTENAIVGLYLDAKLLKTITGTSSENISEEPIQPPEGQKVRIVLDLPTELQGKTGYLVVRVHEGKALTITPEYDPSLQTLTFDGDKFSTYAIVCTTAGGNSGNDGGSSGSGSGSSSNDAYDFWQTVKDKIKTVAGGDTIKVNARANDKMPVGVMNALKDSGVTLVISWKGGETITILAGKAQKSEAGRIYYPLSLLEELYKDAKTDTIGQIAPGVNPETSGVGDTQGTSDKFIPVTGGVWELEAPATVEDEMTSNTPAAITPPTGGFEQNVFAGTPENAAARSNSAVQFAMITAMLAALAGGVMILQKKKSK